MEKTIECRIKLGKETAEHQRDLTDLGYDAREVDDHIIVKVTKLVKDEVNLLTDLKGIIARKEAIGYNTRIKFPNGDVRFGMPAIKMLEKVELKSHPNVNISCLVMKKPVKKPVQPKTEQKSDKIVI